MIYLPITSHPTLLLAEDITNGRLYVTDSNKSRPNIRFSDSKELKLLSALTQRISISLSQLPQSQLHTILESTASLDTIVSHHDRDSVCVHFNWNNKLCEYAPIIEVNRTSKQTILNITLPNTENQSLALYLVMCSQREIEQALDNKFRFNKTPTPLH
ncbi:hypothetical protein AB4254_07915 [Vibrio breoganii]